MAWQVMNARFVDLISANVSDHAHGNILADRSQRCCSESRRRIGIDLAIGDIDPASKEPVVWVDQMIKPKSVLIEVDRLRRRVRERSCIRVRTRNIVLNRQSLRGQPVSRDGVIRKGSPYRRTVNCAGKKRIIDCF